MVSGGPACQFAKSGTVIRTSVADLQATTLILIVLSDLLKPVLMGFPVAHNTDRFQRAFLQGFMSSVVIEITLPSKRLELGEQSLPGKD